jgi:hypothetical protein
MDWWVVKTDASGNILWQKSYGGSSDDLLDGIAIDANGGYILTGFTNSGDGEISGYHGGGDGWIVKIDDTGHIVWDSVMGSSGFDFFNGVLNTPDSGYLVAGSSGAWNGNVPYSYGSNDVWVIKFTKTGALAWNKVYGGTGADYGFNPTLTADGGYIITGVTAGGGMVAGFYGGYGDAWLLKLNDTGGMEWNKNYGGSGYENALWAVQMSNGHYLVSASTNSNNHEVSGNHGGYDCWIYSVDDTGAFLWGKCYGGAGNEGTGINIVPTYDSGFIFESYTSQLSGEVTAETHSTIGATDFWVVKINDNGAIVWENAFGGSGADSAVYIIQTADSGYAVTGASTSNNYDVSGNHGNEDYWLLKLKKDLPLRVAPVEADPAIQVYPTLTNGLVYVVLPQGYEQSTLSLTDMTGRIINTAIGGTPGKRSVQINNLPEGMYLLSVQQGGRVSSYKVIYKP